MNGTMMPTGDIPASAPSVSKTPYSGDLPWVERAAAGYAKRIRVDNFSQAGNSMFTYLIHQAVLGKRAFFIMQPNGLQMKDEWVPDDGTVAPTTDDKTGGDAQPQDSSDTGSDIEISKDDDTSSGDVPKDKTSDDDTDDKSNTDTESKDDTKPGKKSDDDSDTDDKSDKNDSDTDNESDTDKDTDKETDSDSDDTDAKDKNKTDDDSDTDADDTDTKGKDKEDVDSDDDTDSKPDEDKSDSDSDTDDKPDTESADDTSDDSDTDIEDDATDTGDTKSSSDTSAASDSTPTSTTTSTPATQLHHVIVSPYDPIPLDKIGADVQAELGIQPVDQISVDGKCFDAEGNEIPNLYCLYLDNPPITNMAIMLATRAELFDSLMLNSLTDIVTPTKAITGTEPDTRIAKANDNPLKREDTINLNASRIGGTAVVPQIKLLEQWDTEKLISMQRLTANEFIGETGNPPVDFPELGTLTAPAANLISTREPFVSRAKTIMTQVNAVFQTAMIPELSWLQLFPYTPADIASVGDALVKGATPQVLNGYDLN